MESFDLQELRKYEKCVIVFYGNRELLDTEFANIAEWTKQKGLSVYSHDRKSICFLNDIAKQLGNKDVMELILTEQEKTTETDPFLKWLSNLQSHNASPKFILMNQFEYISSELQRTWEEHLIPVISQSSNIKFIIFYKGSQTPSWKRYEFEEFVYPISRVVPELVSFENPYIAGRAMRQALSALFYAKLRKLA